jgi:hypothetical protein
MVEATGIESVLANWPSSVPRRGVAVTVQGEQLVFSNFSIGHGCVLWERSTPDSMGGREIIVPFAEVAAVKLTESLEADTRQEMGFERPA